MTTYRKTVLAVAVAAVMFAFSSTSEVIGAVFEGEVLYTGGTSWHYRDTVRLCYDDWTYMTTGGVQWDPWYGNYAYWIWWPGLPAGYYRLEGNCVTCQCKPHYRVYYNGANQVHQDVYMGACNTPTGGDE